MGYRIGSFNCLSFGMGATKSPEIFAQIIQDEKFDIVALQEIKGRGTLQNRILSQLPSNWTGIADDGYVNDYAFIWNKHRVQLSQYESNGMIRSHKPHIYKQYRIDRSRNQTDLIREPYYARFIPVGGGTPFIEIRILNCHIRYSKGSQNSSSDEQSLGAIAMRKNEFDVLSTTLYPKVANKRYGNNRPSYTILLGDYNLNMKNSEASSPYLFDSIEIQGETIVKMQNGIIRETYNTKHKEDPMHIITMQNDLTTLRNPNDDVKPHGFANNYDHFTYDKKRFSNLKVRCDSIDTVEKYCNGDFEKYRKEVSDHIPIAIEIDFR